MMKLHGYEFELTGGGCSALVRRIGNIEILATDGDLSAPETFPIEVGAFYEDGNFIDGAMINSTDELYIFEKRVTV